MWCYINVFCEVRECVGEVRGSICVEIILYFGVICKIGFGEFCIG